MASSNPSKDYKYRVDLDLSRTPRAYFGPNNLWVHDLGRISKLIRRQLDQLKHQAAQDDHTRTSGASGKNTVGHLSIAIFGPSGSGKSSLLRTMEAQIRQQDQTSPFTELSVASLPVMDPTTWAKSDQFLYAFLASALEEEHKSQERKPYGQPQGLSPVQLRFQEVNEYLRVIDEPEDREEHDPLGLSLQKLERHTSGIRLKDALSKFIDALCRELEVDALLLPVDDLDMAPRHLVTSLQSYQSFLTDPRLIPVLTFTDRMPEELIEVFYREQLKEKEKETLTTSDRLSVSQKLAVQFLARSFPVRNRIKMGPAPARVQRAVFESKASSVSEDQGLAVLELLTVSSFLLFGYPDREDAHRVRAALRPSTLRRQFQVIDAMSDCEIRKLRSPQLALLSDPETAPADLHNLTTADKTSTGSSKRWLETTEHERWQTWKSNKLGGLETTPATFPDLKSGTSDSCRLFSGYEFLARRLLDLKSNATWAGIFNRAVWSLLNVHRDTLRELGLHLEDLYSWTPKELRSVVVDRILGQDQVTRRTVADRWFNRTDYRRSQVLSMLAANIFRPWMHGEEPFGDEERPLRVQLNLEKAPDGGLDRKWKMPKEIDPAELAQQQVRHRLSFDATDGLLWFLNVALGFYLPQIMARNWTDALPKDEPVRRRMSGNGWDLRHGSINALRIADAKREVFSYGMVFLDKHSFRHALESAELERTNQLLKALGPESGEKLTDDEKLKRKEKLKSLLDLGDKAEKEPEGLAGNLEAYLDHRLAGGKESLLKQKIEHFRWQDESLDTKWRNHLLLRIWSGCGYSNGRYWAAFSLWRGLGFIGQVLELGFAEKEQIQKLSNLDAAQIDPSEDKEHERLRGPVLKELERLIRSHCLSGLIPGSLLDRGPDDSQLLAAFSRWEPHRYYLREAIRKLAEDLLDWLTMHQEEVIFPMPAGETWIGWKDCFIRRIHGEYILGSLWLRLNSAYIEEQTRYDCQKRAASRSITEDDMVGEPEPQIEELLKDRGADRYDSRYKWTAAVAAGAWSDILLDYWRGCRPILKLLLTCPTFFKSRERFGPSPLENGGEEKNLSAEVFEALASDEGDLKDLARKGKSEEFRSRLAWLDRLALSSDDWKQLASHLNDPSKNAIVPDELCIERVQIGDFAHQSYREGPSEEKPQE